MTETSYASVKDLVSTGYFFEELKKYTLAKEIDLPSFSRDFVVPYLTRKSESYQMSGQANRTKILNLAVKFLYQANDEEMAETILGLKKVAASEVDANERELYKNDQLDKSGRLSCRQKSEAAQALGKLLRSIVRTFKLVEVGTERNESGGACGRVGEAIQNYWKLSVLPSS